MKQNVIPLNTLFKYYQIVVRANYRELFQKYPDYEGYFWFSTFRSYKRMLKCTDIERKNFVRCLLIDSIKERLTRLERPTARTEKIRRILEL